jgi:hypothetical protein
MMRPRVTLDQLMAKRFHDRNVAAPQVGYLPAQEY